MSRNIHRAPVNWSFVVVATALWAVLSLTALADVWSGLWRSYSFPGATPAVGSREQMMAGLIGFMALLLAFALVPKRREQATGRNRQYVWSARVGASVALLLLAIGQMIEAHLLGS